MANPAELLLDIFNDWNDPKNSAKYQRKDAKLVVHRRAVKHLEAIEEILAELRVEGIRTSVFEREFPSWLRTVFCYPTGWTNGGTAKIPQSAMDALENLVGYADQVVLKIDDSKLAYLGLYLDAIEFTLKNDSSLNARSRLQLQTAIDHVRHCIEEINIVGKFDFKKSLETLLIRLAQVEGVSKNKDAWKPWKEHFIWPFIYDSSKYAIGYGIGAASDVVLPMLTG